MFKACRLGRMHNPLETEMSPKGCIEKDRIAHMLSIAALLSAGDAHYIYRNVDSFSGFGPLDCHNRKELVAWLDRIKQESQDAAGFHLIEDPPDQALSASPVGSPLRPANQPPFVAYRSLPSTPLASSCAGCVPSSAARWSESAWHHHDGTVCRLGWRCPLHCKPCSKILSFGGCF